jgi:hypothetical protein
MSWQKMKMLEDDPTPSRRKVHSAEAEQVLPTRSAGPACLLYFSNLDGVDFVWHVCFESAVAETLMVCLLPLAAKYPMARVQ